MEGGPSFDSLIIVETMFGLAAFRPLESDRHSLRPARAEEQLMAQTDSDKIADTILRLAIYGGRERTVTTAEDRDSWQYTDCQSAADAVIAQLACAKDQAMSARDDRRLSESLAVIAAIRVQSARLGLWTTADDAQQKIADILAADPAEVLREYRARVVAETAAADDLALNEMD